MTGIQVCVRQYDQDIWASAVQMKPKLRTYKMLKAGVRREEYLSWEITDEQRVLYARLRSGSHQLRIERGRWEHEVEAERLCLVCGTGVIENERHFLLECSCSSAPAAICIAGLSRRQVTTL